MYHPLGPLFKSADIQFVQGFVQTINTHEQTIQVQSSSGKISSINYNRLIVASGSALGRLASVTSLDKPTFDIDSLSGASKLESHLQSLGSLPSSKSRDTFVVRDAGFTGIELATELLVLLKHIENPRIVLVEGAQHVGPELGPGPRPTLTKALKELGIEVKLGTPVSSVDDGGVTLASGDRIEANTVVWTAGIRANVLTQQIPGSRDPLGRLHVSRDLRVPDCEHIFAAGNTACAATDDEGHTTLMSCQHAMALGRFAGYNAAAEVLNEPTIPYNQPWYGCLLDLGPWGAMIITGWNRDVKVTGQVAKQVKRWINQKLAYPSADLQEAFKSADPTAKQEGFLSLVLSVLAWTLSTWRPFKAIGYGRDKTSGGVSV